MEFMNRHRVSSSENPFGYLWPDNCALYLTVVAFLLLKGQKIGTSHSGTKNSTRKKLVFEDEAAELGKRISIAKAELERQGTAGN